MAMSEVIINRVNGQFILEGETFQLGMSLNNALVRLSRAFPTDKIVQEQYREGEIIVRCHEVSTTIAGISMTPTLYFFGYALAAVSFASGPGECAEIARHTHTGTQTMQLNEAVNAHRALRDWCIALHGASRS